MYRIKNEENSSYVLYLPKEKDVRDNWRSSLGRLVFGLKNTKIALKFIYTYVTF